MDRPPRSTGAVLRGVWPRGFETGLTMADKPTSASDRGEKRIFTTGEAAQICNLSQQTIIRCFDSGRLGGFRVPGSRFRRIPRDSLVEFMKNSGIPLENLSSGRKRVLIVDDDHRIIDLVTDILERDGRFEVHSASNGYDAGLKTAAVKPDLILLDFMLPDINGDVVLSRVREMPEADGMKILLVSGVVNEEEIAHLLEQGAEGFVKKPFRPAELIEKIEAALGLGAPSQRGRNGGL